MERQTEAVRATSGRSSIPRAVLAVVLSLVIAAVRAESPPPSDTDAITSLTPEQARKLAAEFPGVDVEIDSPFHEKQQVRCCLPLNGLTSVDAETAQALASYAKGPLVLNGLTTLDVDTARALAGFHGDELWLIGLTTLDADAAKALAESKSGILNLGVPTTFDASTARAITEFKGPFLRLSGLTTLGRDAAKALAESNRAGLDLHFQAGLDADVAEELAGCKGDSLGLHGLTTLDADTAKALAAFKGRSLGFNGLPSLDAASARAVSAFKGQKLWFGSLAALDATAAKELAAWQGQYLFIGLKELDAETCRALAAYKKSPERSLTFTETLTRISADTVKAVAELPEHLHLQSLTTLDAAAAEAIVALGEGWDGSLPGMTALDTADSIAVAKALASCRRPVALPNLVKISPKALAALLEKEDILMPRLANLELIAEPDGSGTEDFVVPEGFEERELQRIEQMRAVFGLGE